LYFRLKPKLLLAPLLLPPHNQLAVIDLPIDRELHEVHICWDRAEIE
jgi:hypothetical protein